MIEDSVNNLPQTERKDIIIGGNFCSWYGGFDSYIVAQEADCPIYIPSMGRKIEGEEQMPNLNHLPYMNWVEWIKTLNNFKYGVHLMRTHAAGTFALNCAYLGIPCIGYEGLDTQEICHKDLTVKLGDLVTAKEKLTRLKTDKHWYNKCSQTAKEQYKKYYQENKFSI
jgi:glutaredoxin-related protein